MTEKTQTNDVRINLSELAKISAEDFERHFREWMERDEVARSLQAKLRMDLIANFNKTSLGKQILAQTTMTTHAYGGSHQRLTLSPLVLGLNTLVAEFLYSQNCHFTLSVFCTEVPYRNTLPDFESMRVFRFSQEEVMEIIEAIVGRAVVDPKLKNRLAKSYEENGNSSLLLLTVKALLDIKSLPPPQPKREETQSRTRSSSVRDSQTAERSTGGQASGNENHAQFAANDRKNDTNNSNFRHLNKYLIILTKKVNEMTQQFQLMLENHMKDGGDGPLWKQPLRKSHSMRRYEQLNRSLERITDNLRQVSHAKRKNKYVSAIVAAIEGLAMQFSKCSANFENVASAVSGRRGIWPGKSKDQSGAGESDGHRKTCGRAEKQIQTEQWEKSYDEWLHEMRTTKNGQRFLNKVENTLLKALAQQKEQLDRETTEKLKHQHELLRIRYKLKLSEYLSKSHQDAAVETQRVDESIEQQLRQFDVKHQELIEKIRRTEEEVKTIPQRLIRERTFLVEDEYLKENDDREEEVIQQKPARKRTPLYRDTPSQTTEREPTPLLQPQPQPRQLTPRPKNKPKPPRPKMPPFQIQKELTEVFGDLAMEERNVEQIITEAKERMQELEFESSRLQSNFRQYLERQRVNKRASEATVSKLLENVEAVRREMHQTVAETSKKRKIQAMREGKAYRLAAASELERKFSAVDLSGDIARKVTMDEAKETEHQRLPVTTQFRNPIKEAKERFFERERQFKEHLRGNCGDNSTIFFSQAQGKVPPPRYLEPAPKESSSVVVVMGLPLGEDYNDYGRQEPGEESVDPRYLLSPREQRRPVADRVRRYSLKEKQRAYKTALDGSDNRNRNRSGKTSDFICRPEPKNQIPTENAILTSVKQRGQRPPSTAGFTAARKDDDDDDGDLAYIDDDDDGRDRNDDDNSDRLLESGDDHDQLEGEEEESNETKASSVLQQSMTKMEQLFADVDEPGNDAADGDDNSADGDLGVLNSYFDLAKNAGNRQRRTVGVGYEEDARQQPRHIATNGNNRKNRNRSGTTKRQTIERKSRGNDDNYKTIDEAGMGTTQASASASASTQALSSSGNTTTVSILTNTTAILQTTPDSAPVSPDASSVVSSLSPQLPELSAAARNEIQSRAEEAVAMVAMLGHHERRRERGEHQNQNKVSTAARPATMNDRKVSLGNASPTAVMPKVLETADDVVHYVQQLEKRVDDSADDNGELGEVKEAVDPVPGAHGLTENVMPPSELFEAISSSSHDSADTDSKSYRQQLSASAGHRRRRHDDSQGNNDDSEDFWQ